MSVVVTGGSRGIGRYLAEGFATAGYSVVLTARSRDHAEASAAEIAAETGASVLGVAFEAASPDSAQALADAAHEAARAAGETVDVLVNNAGLNGTTEGPLWEAPAEDLVAVTAANVTGPLLTIRAFAPAMLEAASRDGRPRRIIDLNSGSGSHGTPASAVYSASKAALFRVADSVHHYGYDRGLRIFEMSPGVVETDMTAAMSAHRHRTGDDWTSPASVVALALALASGELDAYSGRFVRAGQDAPEALRAAAATLGPDTRRLVLGR